MLTRTPKLLNKPLQIALALGDARHKPASRAGYSWMIGLKALDKIPKLQRQINKCKQVVTLS